MTTSGAGVHSGRYRVLTRGPAAFAPLTDTVLDDGWREVASASMADHALDHYRETAVTDGHLVVLRGPMGACLRFGVSSHGELLDVPRLPRKYAPTTLARLSVKVPRASKLLMGASVLGGILGNALAETDEDRQTVNGIAGLGTAIGAAGITPIVEFTVPAWERPRDPVAAWAEGYEGVAVTGDQLMRWFPVEVGGIPALLDCVESIGDTTTRARFSAGGIGDYYPRGVVRVSAARGTADPAVVQQRLTDAAAFLRSRVPLGALLSRLAVRAMVDRTHRALTRAEGIHAHAAASLRIEPATLRHRIYTHNGLAAWAV